jgi:UDPglucose 6-dehydrogenase
MAHIAVFGLWHLGSVVSAALAGLGHRVRATDFDLAAVETLARGVPPVAEPGLEELIAAGRAAGRLAFVPDARAALDGAEAAFVTFDTPVDEADRADTAPLERAIAAIADASRERLTVVVMSQAPVGSLRRWAKRLSAARPGLRATLLYQPENLRLGQALETFLAPDFVLVGVREPADAEQLEPLYAGISAPRRVVGWESAELAKHALNALLATEISFANELAGLAEAAGADVREVVATLRLDRRVGPHAFLAPGTGYSGGTLGRDVEALRALGAARGRPTELLDAVAAVNRGRLPELERRIESACGGLDGRTVALLGLVYKPGTTTLRRSHALALARALVAAGARVRGFDPGVPPGAPGAEPVEICADAAAAVGGADAVVITTPWPEFRSFDWAALARAAGGCTLLDPHNLLDERAAARAGWRHLGSGLGTARELGESPARGAAGVGAGR